MCVGDPAILLTDRLPSTFRPIVTYSVAGKNIDISIERGGGGIFGNYLHKEDINSGLAPKQAKKNANYYPQHLPLPFIS